MIRLWAVLAMAGLMSCTPSVETREVCSVLYDTTDPLRATPEAAVLWQFMEADDNDKYLIFRYAMLSDVELNVVHQLERPARASGLLDNAVSEKKRMRSFKKQFDSLMGQTDSIGASHSAIFKPILEELAYLATMPATDERHLVVFSNLRENSDWLSFYNESDFWHLRNQPDAIAERYLAQVPEGANYRGVQLHIVYRPTDHSDNTQFKQLRELYTRVFNHLEVPITFSANLNKAKTAP